LKSVTLVRDIVTGFSRKYGFVEFKDPHDMKTAQRKEHNTSIKGRVILVDRQHQHNLSGWIPRRLGMLSFFLIT
jgi:U11/U12 small nuclear ribonucleoprotein SNRNP35